MYIVGSWGDLSIRRRVGSDQTVELLIARSNK